MTTEAEFRAKHDARVIEAMARAICVYETGVDPNDPANRWRNWINTARAALGAYRAAMWMPMSEAPEDVHILFSTNDAHGLPPFTAIVKYHPYSGWCVDELRESIGCQPLPLPPEETP